MRVRVDEPVPPSFVDGFERIRPGDGWTGYRWRLTCDRAIGADRAFTLVEGRHWTPEALGGARPEAFRHRLVLAVAPDRVTGYVVPRDGRGYAALLTLAVLFLAGVPAAILGVRGEWRSTMPWFAACSAAAAVIFAVAARMVRSAGRAEAEQQLPAVLRALERAPD